MFIITKRWKHPKCPLTDEWINRMWYIHAMKCHLSIKQNEVLIYVTTWKNMENIMQVKEARHEKSHIV